MNDSTQAEVAALRALAGRLIPKSEAFGAPGADDAAIFEAIEASLEPSLPQLANLLADLASMGAGAIAERSLEAPLGELAAGHGPAFGVVAAAVIQAYYRDDRVMLSLGLEPRPPYPKGHAVEEGDFELLAPVRERGRIWRDAVE